MHSDGGGEIETRWSVKSIELSTIFTNGLLPVALPRFERFRLSRVLRSGVCFSSRSSLKCSMRATEDAHPQCATKMGEGEKTLYLHIKNN